MACTNVACGICEAEARNSRAWDDAVSFALDVRFELPGTALVSGELTRYAVDLDGPRTYPGRSRAIGTAPVEIPGEG